MIVLMNLADLVIDIPASAWDQLHDVGRRYAENRSRWRGNPSRLSTSFRARC
jgi:hypothetical protein